MSKTPLDRRRFLVNTSTAVGAVAVGVATTAGAGAVSAADSSPPGSGTGREGDRDRGRARVRVPVSGLEEWTISELQEAMRSGRHSALALTRRYREQIEAVDRRGPALRSVIEVNPEAEAIARALDRERKERGPRGLLHGIPVMVKDNIDTADRMATTAGSLALVGAKPLQDAGLVQRLRAAGAVIVGKTNLSEWANFRGRYSSSGWSGRGGQTRNPYVLDRNPSGSSSGSAVAVAASLCAVAVGTETDGSIVSPASYNGIVGLKPTVGLISRSGIIPISSSQDTAGPMTRTVRDAAVLLGVLAGGDSRDPAMAEADAHLPPDRDYTRFLDLAALRGARIGIDRATFGFHRLVDPLMENLVAALRREGAVVIDPVKFPGERDRSAAEFEVFLYEFKAGLNAYLASLGATAPVKSLREVIAFNDQHRDEELRWFGQEHLIEAETRGPLTDERYLKAVATCRRLARDEGIDAVMAEHRLDAIFAPTGGPAHVTDRLFGNHGRGGSSSTAAVAGYPNITVPAGQVLGLPVGASFFGRAWSEPKLLGIAYAFEQLIQARKAPEYLKSVGGT